MTRYAKGAACSSGTFVVSRDAVTLYFGDNVFHLKTGRRRKASLDDEQEMATTTTSTIHMTPATNTRPNAVSTSIGQPSPSAPSAVGHTTGKPASQPLQCPTNPASAHTIAGTSTLPSPPAAQRPPTSITQPASSNSRRLSHISVATWIGVILALAASTAAIYYSEYTKRLARWTASNDFRGTCLSYLEHGLASSSSCNETLAKPPIRPPIYKRAEGETNDGRGTSALFWAVAIAIPVVTLIFFKVTLRGFVESRPRPVISQARVFCDLGQDADEHHVVWCGINGGVCEAQEENITKEQEPIPVEDDSEEELAVLFLEEVIPSNDVCEIQEELVTKQQEPIPVEDDPEGELAALVLKEVAPSDDVCKALGESGNGDQVNPMTTEAHDVPQQQLPALASSPSGPGRFLNLSGFLMEPLSDQDAPLNVPHVMPRPGQIVHFKEKGAKNRDCDQRVMLVIRNVSGYAMTCVPFCRHHAMNLQADEMHWNVVQHSSQPDPSASPISSNVGVGAQSADAIVKKGTLIVKIKDDDQRLCPGVTINLTELQQIEYDQSSLLIIGSVSRESWEPLMKKIGSLFTSSLEDCLPRVAPVTIDNGPPEPVLRDTPERSSSKHKRRKVGNHDQRGRHVRNRGVRVRFGQ